MIFMVMEKRTTIQCGQSIADRLRKYEVAFGKTRDEMLDYLMEKCKDEFVQKLEAQIASLKAVVEPMSIVENQ